jgi:putative transposase
MAGPLDTPHLWAVLRYTELNPVRAQMVARAEDYRWSTAAAHYCGAPADAWLDTEVFAASWTPALWREYLGGGEAEEELASIRENTHTGRPLGSAEFVSGLERTLRRKLVPAKGGRPAKERLDERQERLFLEG